MKHATNRSKSTGRTKEKNLIQNKAVTETKSATKKPISKTVSKSEQPIGAQKVKQADVKASSKISLSATKSAVEELSSKLSTKSPAAQKTVSAQKVKPVIEQTKKPRTKKAELKAFDKAIEKPTVEKTTKTSAVRQKNKAKTTVVKPQASGNAFAKTLVKVTKDQSTKVQLRSAKSAKLKIENFDATTTKSSTKKPNLIVKAEAPEKIKKTKSVIVDKTVKQPKIAPIIAATAKVNSKSKKVQPIIITKEVIQKSKKTEPAIEVKEAVKKATKVKKVLAEKESVIKIQNQDQKTAVSIAEVKKRTPKVEKSLEEIESNERAIETIELLPQKPKNKKVKPIGSAVFRGKKARYDFKVFELNENFEPIPAVYIISKRKIDRNKKGHHALICIGETASISDELKRHRKGKCVKKHAANVVSILPEVDEKIRLQIETDLKAAHTIVCKLD